MTNHIWPLIELPPALQGRINIDQPYFQLSGNCHTTRHRGKIVSMKPRPKTAPCGVNIWKCKTLDHQYLFPQYVSGVRIYYKVENEGTTAEPPNEPLLNTELLRVISTLEN